MAARASLPASGTPVRAGRRRVGPAGARLLPLEDMLLDFGCTVVGPAARLSTALEMAQNESFEVAILDVNVAGEPIYPVAEAIVSRNLPIVFSTGYGGAGIREPFRERPVVQKPFSQADLKRTLIAAVAAARA